MLVASAFAEVSCAFFFWFKNSGMAIAARMPMMIMTTRSSMSVKPCSFSSMALRSRASIAVLLGDDVNPVKGVRLLAESDRGSWADREGPLALRPHLAAGVPFLAVLYDKGVFGVTPLGLEQQRGRPPQFTQMNYSPASH